jgi:molybdate transport system substrate-binding protein
MHLAMPITQDRIDSLYMPVYKDLRMPILRILSILVFLVTPAFAEPIRVAAAISLKDALGEAARSYEAETGDRLVFTFGSSGQLMTQIRNGAPIDVFVSAAAKQMDDLQKENLVDPATRVTVASNSLVLIVPAGREAPASFEALANVAGRIAAGEPKTVPAGQYAAEVFRSLKITDALKGRLVYGTNVRQVLAYVERGEVAAGVVYSTDAKEAGEKVRVVATAPAGSHQPIVYAAAVVTAARQPAAARRFLSYLATSEKARSALTSRGFMLPEKASSRPAADK